MPATAVRKSASELGGQGNETSFEQSLSTIAYPYLRDKAPRFVNSLVGFQLLDKDPDGDNAVGVFAFKPGGKWYYAPIVYRDGKIKGHELLYDVSADRFIPFKENWVNSLDAQRPDVLGDRISRNSASLGVRSPNLAPYMVSPTKYAAWIRQQLDRHVDGYIDADYLPAARLVDRLRTQPVSALPAGLDLRAFLKTAGAAMTEKLVLTCLRYPRLGAAMENLYGDLPTFFRGCLPDKRAMDEPPSEFPSFPRSEQPLTGPAALRSLNDIRRRKRRRVPILGEEPAKQAAKKDPGQQVDVIEYSKDLNPDGLSAEEKEQLLQDGALVRDRRPAGDVNIAYRLQTPTALMNPDRTGIYQVLLTPGTFETCLVLLGPVSPEGQHSFATVVSLDDPKRWQNIHPSLLFVLAANQQTPLGKEVGETDFPKWLAGLPDADELPTSGRRGLYLIIGSTGGTTPLEPEQRLVRGETDVIYRCRFRDYADQERPDHLPPLRHDRVMPRTPGVGERVHFSGQSGSKLVAYGNDLYVPKGFKLFKLRDAEPREDYDGPEETDERDPFLAGQPRLLTEMAYQKTAALVIRRDGREYTVNGTRLASPVKALTHLVTRIGLGEKQARLLLTDPAADISVWESAYRLKHAGNGPYELQQGGPSVTSDMEPPTGQEGLYNSIPSEYPLHRRDRADATYADPGQIRQQMLNYVNPWDAQVMEQGAQSGDKQQFEGLAIGTLIRSHGDEFMVDDHLPKFKAFVDACGRVLLSYYLHGDRFEDRFGKADMQELEDGLRNAFDAAGDVTLKLQEQAINPEMDASGSGKIEDRTDAF